MKEAEEGELYLDSSMSESVIKVLIDHIYGRDINIPWDDIKDFLDAVEILCLNELKNKIDEHISSHLHPETCLEWYYLADRYRIKNTMTNAKKILTTHFIEVGKSDGFAALTLAEVIELLSLTEVSSGSADDVLSVSINWILADEDSRKNHLSDLLARIDVTKCSPGYLKHVLDTYTNRLITDLTVYAKINKVVTASITPFDVGTAQAQKQAAETTRQSKSEYVMLGGQMKNGIQFKKIFQIDFEKKKCDEIGVLPTVLQRKGSARCVTSHGVFHAGGEDGETGTKQCHLFDIKTHQITQLPDLPSPSKWSAATAIDNMVYVMGGDGTEKRVLCLDVANPVMWNRCSDMVKGVTSPIAWSIGKQVFVFSRVGSHEEKILECFDPLDNTWVIKSTPPRSSTSTLGKCVAVINTDAYILGGLKGLCLCYRSSTDQWEEFARPAEQHYDGSVVCINDHTIMLCGGWHGLYQPVTQ